MPKQYYLQVACMGSAEPIDGTLDDAKALVIESYEGGNAYTQYIYDHYEYWADMDIGHYPDNTPILIFENGVWFERVQDNA